MTILVLIGTIVVVICEMFHGMISLNSVLLLLLLNFVKGFILVGIDIYISHQKHLVKFHSFPWFSADCAADIVHNNHFFICTNRRNLLNLKQSSGSLAILAKGLLKLPNLPNIPPTSLLLLPPTLKIWFPPFCSSLH